MTTMPITTVFDPGLPRESLLVVSSNPDKIAQVMDREAPLHRIRLELSGVRLDVVGANDYGSVELCTFPDRNLVVIASEANVSIVKAGTATGIVAATDLDVALGTAPASATTLATTMLNILPKVDLDTDSLTVTLQSHSLAATPVLTGVLDAPTNKLYFNLACATVITVDDYVTLTGTVDLWVFDLGNVTS
jgi:hypothetical protein